MLPTAKKALYRREGDRACGESSASARFAMMISALKRPPARTAFFPFCRHGPRWTYSLDVGVSETAARRDVKPLSHTARLGAISA